MSTPADPSPPAPLSTAASVPIPDDDTDVGAAELEATPADDGPSPDQQSDTVYILSWQDCCERPLHEDTSQIPTFDNACTPCEYKLRAGHADDHPY
eukprot:2735404-Pyramimonas_sp.AAC.1